MSTRRGPWQVIRHDVTTGRDSGYPIKVAASPLFASRADAQAEAEHLLSRLAPRERTSRVLTINPSTGTYSGPHEERPTYEVVPVAVLSRAEAAERAEAREATTKQAKAEQAARLRAQADALEASA